MLEKILPLIMLGVIAFLYYILIGNKNCQCDLPPPCKPCQPCPQRKCKRCKVYKKTRCTSGGCAKRVVDDTYEIDGDVDSPQRCGTVDYIKKNDEFCYKGFKYSDRTQDDDICEFSLAGLILKQLKTYNCISDKMHTLIKDSKSRVFDNVTGFIRTSVDELLEQYDNKSNPLRGSRSDHFNIVKKDYRIMYNFLHKNPIMKQYERDEHETEIMTKLYRDINRLDSFVRGFKATK